MGVSWDKRKQRWFSQIQQHGRRRFLGYFAGEGDAARAYDRRVGVGWVRVLVRVRVLH